MFGLHDNEAILPSGTGGSQVDQQLTGKREGTSDKLQQGWVPFILSRETEAGA